MHVRLDTPFFSMLLSKKTLLMAIDMPLLANGKPNRRLLKKQAVQLTGKMLDPS